MTQFVFIRLQPGSTRVVVRAGTYQQSLKPISRCDALEGNGVTNGYKVRIAHIAVGMHIGQNDQRIVVSLPIDGEGIGFSAHKADLC